MGRNLLFQPPPCPATHEGLPHSMRVFWTTYPSPIGSLILAEAEGRPIVVEFALRAKRMRWMERLRAQGADSPLELGPCATTARWLDAYFEGRPRAFAYPEYLAQYMEVTPSQRAVWARLCAIPLGETRSYDDIARETGLHPRLVGQLNGANHLAILVPCHRVVGKNGSLVGYGGGLQKKAWLLTHEVRIAGVQLR